MESAPQPGPAYFGAGLEGLTRMDLDDEFAEIIALITPRQRECIILAADSVARDIKSDAAVLGGSAVSTRNSDQLLVLNQLPQATFAQSGFWRYQLAQAAQRLAEDTRRWGAPVPRCTGEEMMLHIILRRAMSLARVRKDRAHRWYDLFEYLLQDHDVLILYDMPADVAESIVTAVNLDPRRWFSEFTLPYPVPDRPIAE